jgi:hypothetical protein
MNAQKPNTPARSVKTEPNKDAKAAYEAKQAKDVKESVARQRAADMMPRHESPKKAAENQQTTGHSGHTHDHLKPQSPFHLDKRASQEQDNDYYHGMSQ